MGESTSAIIAKQSVANKAVAYPLPEEPVVEHDVDDEKGQLEVKREIYGTGADQQVHPAHLPGKVHSYRKRRGGEVEV